MLCHEDLMSYYTTNNSLLFRKRGDFEQHMTLTELEDMLPFERTVYLIQIHNKIEAHEQQKSSK